GGTRLPRRGPFQERRYRRALSRLRASGVSTAPRPLRAAAVGHRSAVQPRAGERGDLWRMCRGTSHAGVSMSGARVTIVTEASSRVGSGHFHESVAIAEAFRGRNSMSVELVVNADAPERLVSRATVPIRAAISFDAAAC